MVEPRFQFSVVEIKDHIWWSKTWLCSTVASSWATGWLLRYKMPDSPSEGPVLESIVSGFGMLITRV